MSKDLEKRLKDVEDRLDRVEVERQAPVAAPAVGFDPEIFWALEGLKARQPDPGGVIFTGAVSLEDGRRAEWQQEFALPEVLDGFDAPAASALSALAHPVRLLILRELLRAERSTAELGEVDGLGTSGQIYHHLRQLIGAGWLRASTRGRYGVPTERVVPLLVILAAVAS